MDMLTVYQNKLIKILNIFKYNTKASLISWSKR